MARYKWSQLTTQHVGAYTEYFVKMELTMYGFQVYETEVDDRGIDFVARYERGPFLEIQVKSLRPPRGKYAFLPKDKLRVHEHTYVALGLMEENKAPSLYLIPSTAWNSPSGCFVDRNYEGKKSKPEWGIQVARKHMEQLRSYLFDLTAERLIEQASAPKPAAIQRTQALASRRA